jgi:hypothetical protein
VRSKDGGGKMKRVFTICVPDDCYLKVANIVALVEKDDHSDNGLTIFTADNNDEGQEWLFTTNGKAKKIELSSEVDENKEYEIVNLGNGLFEKRYKAESEV